MGVPEKCHHGEVNINKDPKRADQLDKTKWVIAGIEIRKQPMEEEDDTATTPTSEECRIPAKACPPPPPRKRKSAPAHASLPCTHHFFCPPDLDTVFVRRHLA